MPDQGAIITRRKATRYLQRLLVQSRPDFIGGYIECEMDGIPLEGVKHVTIELDRDGGRCLMLFSDPTISAHLIAQDGAVRLMAGRVQ